MQGVRPEYENICVELYHHNIRGCNLYFLWLFLFSRCNRASIESLLDQKNFVRQTGDGIFDPDGDLQVYFSTFDGGCH